MFYMYVMVVLCAIDNYVHACIYVIMYLNYNVILQLQYALLQLTVEESHLVISQYLLISVALNYLAYHLLHLDSVFNVQMVNTYVC